MKLIVDIPEEQYRTLNSKTQEEVVAVIDDKVINTAVKNGTPLSESEDCISRKKALDICSAYAGHGCIWWEIKSLPSVTPTEKVGRWVYNKNLSTYYGDVYTCSECGERCLESCYDHIDKLPNFCPKCHIKMEVGE